MLSNKNNTEALHQCDISPSVAQTFSAVAEFHHLFQKNILGGSFVFCCQSLV